MKTSVPAAPPAPAPITPQQTAQANIDYTMAMASPAVQGAFLAAEQQYRPEYTALNLQELNQYLQGTGGAPGILAQQDIAARAAADTSAATTSIQRAADIQDVMRLGPQAAQAFRAANPELQAALSRAEALQGGQPGYNEFAQGALAMQERAQGMPELGAAGGILAQRAQQLAGSTGKLTAEELRSGQQAIREAYASRGTEMGSGAISAEALGRLANERGRMQEDLALAASLNQGTLQERGANRAFQQQALGNLGLLGQLRGNELQANRGYAMNLVGAQQAVASDPFQAILGRPSQALGAAQFQQQYAGGLAGSMQGPQLFDPNAGANLLFQNQANQQQYNTSVYGAQMGLAGAKAGATGAMVGGLLSGLGAVGGGFAAGCWVAREVFGVDNPQWLQFFDWKENHAPKWFRWLYNKHGEAFARFIADKPRLKNVVRKWMLKRIESLN